MRQGGGLGKGLAPQKGDALQARFIQNARKERSGRNIFTTTGRPCVGHGATGATDGAPLHPQAGPLTGAFHAGARQKTVQPEVVALTGFPLNWFSLKKFVHVFFSSPPLSK